MIINQGVSTVLLTVLILIALGYIDYKYVAPILFRKSIKRIELNPKWITPILKERYYGFQDIDIIIAESKVMSLPIFQMSKDNKRYELLISNDYTTNDIDKIAQIALIGKISTKYKILINNKSPQWISILCYMLDGGDINISATKWSEPKEENRQETN